jgi:intracellular sulfur oxidation DsrE/DsrF family protein
MTRRLPIGLSLLLRCGLLLSGIFAVTTSLHPAPLASGYVFSVTVTSARELDVVLDRAEDLRDLFDPAEHSRIAIVLHGDELHLFERRNYSMNQSVVERARTLDQDNIIDIKACQTMMRALDIGQSELPSFIEQVPFAPAEIERLQREEEFTRL